MPVGIETQPLKSNQPPGYQYFGNYDTPTGIDPAITLATINALVASSTQLPAGLSAPLPPGVGAVVQYQSWNGLVSGAASAPAYPTVALSATSVDYLLCGVIAGGQGGQYSPVAQGVGNPQGQYVNIRRIGICPVLVDATATVGQVLIQSTTTAGLAHPTAASVAGQTIGTVLSPVTVSSGIGMVFADLHFT